MATKRTKSGSGTSGVACKVPGLDSCDGGTISDSWPPRQERNIMTSRAAIGEKRLDHTLDVSLRAHGLRTGVNRMTEYVLPNVLPNLQV